MVLAPRFRFRFSFSFIAFSISMTKERIMEVYLNSIEMGKGIYGAQAAAKYKFNTTAAKLIAAIGTHSWLSAD